MWSSIASGSSSGGVEGRGAAPPRPSRRERAELSEFASRERSRGDPLFFVARTHRVASTAAAVARAKSLPMCAPSESAFRSAKKYACVILAIVTLHLALGIGLSVLSSNSWTLAGGVVAFILNIVSTSMVLCCSRKEDARRLCAVVFMAFLAAIAYTISAGMQALVIVPILAFMLSAESCSLCTVAGALYILQAIILVLLAILDLIFACRVCAAKKQLSLNDLNPASV